MTGYNVYDFDGTIYAGDSSKDLYLFVLHRHPKAMLAVPTFLKSVFLYALKKYSKEQMKECFFAVLKFVPDIDAELHDFWRIHKKKIYSWYCVKDHSMDIIISASPEFLISPVMKLFQIVAVIGTVVDPKTGLLLSKNCYGEEKVRRLNMLLDTPVIESFYSDSKADTPLAQMAKQAYFIRQGSLAIWD